MFTSRRRCQVSFPGGKRLPAREITLECRVFGEVPDEHVLPTTGQSGAADLVSGELFRESLVEAFDPSKGIEHFPVARGVGAASLDDVAPVLAVSAGRVQELASVGQRVAEVVAQPRGVLAIQNVRVGAETDDNVPGVDRDGWLTAGEFLDQPPRGDFRYPRRGSSGNQTTYGRR